MGKWREKRDNGDEVMGCMSWEGAGYWVYKYNFWGDKSEIMSLPSINIAAWIT